MKKTPKLPKLAPIVDGSSAVRVGGAALAIARDIATKQGLTLRQAIESLLLQFAAGKAQAQVDAILAEVCAGGEPPAYFPDPPAKPAKSVRRPAKPVRKKGARK